MTRGEMKRLAKLKMRAPTPNGFVVALALYLIAQILTTISQSITMGPLLNEVMGDPERAFELMQSGYLPEIPIYGKLLTLAIGIISYILNFGFILYCLSIVRDLPAGIGTLFDGFGLFFKILWLNFRIALSVALWSLLLFVPGIIAAYNYRQAAYILMDHPEWSVGKCMRESKALMRGNRMKLFVLDLSFLGWVILSLVPFVQIYVWPYTECTYAIFYNQLIGWQPEQPDASALPEKAPWEY